MIDAIVILKLRDGPKEVNKSHIDKNILEKWIVSMSENNAFSVGYLTSGTFAIARLEVNDELGVR